MQVRPDPRAERRLQAAYALVASRYARWVAPRFRPLARDLLASPQPPADPGLDVAMSGDEIDAYLALRRQRDAIVARTSEAPPQPAGKPDKQLQAAFDELQKLIDKNLAQRAPEPEPVKQP